MAIMIDQLDQQILEVISCNARAAFKDIADSCGVSRAAVHQRVLRMTREGVITGSGFQVSPRALGYDTCTYVGITLERGSMYNRVVEQLEKIPEIVECHFTTGAYSLLVKLYCRNNEDLKRLLNDSLQQIDGVISTETLISLEQSINRNIPINLLTQQAKRRRRSSSKAVVLEDCD